MRFRRRGSEELARGYALAAELARRRKELVESMGDKAEAKQWGKVERYCRVMAQARLYDEPTNGGRIDYDPPREIPMDPWEIQWRIAREVQWEADLELDVSEEEDPRRPIERWKRMALAAAMQALSPRERILVQMSYGWGLPREIVAEALGCDRSAVDTGLMKARKKFERIRAEAQNLPEIG